MMYTKYVISIENHSQGGMMVGNAATKLDLGVILCKVCSTVIDTVDSENVVTYYSVCQDPSCSEAKQEKYDLD